jgi:NAD(P)-dependent dehydrogenase (short-subunit alcohol dehydrogenase family)
MPGSRKKGVSRTKILKRGAGMERFKGKTALVTGGGSGIGRATAIAFAREGARVAVVDMDEPGGEMTVRLIADAGGEAIFVKCDVSKAVEVEKMVKKAVDTYGSLDCAFNNAGIGIMASTVDCTEELWDLTMSVNLKGVWLCMKHEINQMLKHGGGRIVNTASAAALTIVQGHAPYTASKIGVVGLTKVAALDCGSLGIRVNAVCPGPILTPMLEPLLKADPAVKGFVEQGNPMGRMGQSEEVAGAVLWLCSEEASYVTGVALPVDGGVVAGSVVKKP